MRDWRTFVRALIRRYRGRIEAYELWVLGNDPRFFTGPTETLVEMTRQANVIMATVVCPGMGRLWTAEGRRVLERFAELGGYQYCEVASIKLYQQSAAGPPETMLKILQVVDGDLRLGENACEGSVTSPSNGTDARVPIRSAGGRTYMRTPEMICGEQHRPEVRNRHPFPGAQRVRSCDQAVLEPVVAAGTSSETG